MSTNVAKLNETIVQNTLIDLGIPPSLTGFTNLTKAIMLACGDPSYKSQITKRLYPDVAAMVGSTSTKVERTIRHAIEVAWDRGDAEVLNTYFGHTIQSSKGKPTNSEFIATVVLRLEQACGKDDE